MSNAKQEPVFGILSTELSELDQHLGSARSCINCGEVEKELWAALPPFKAVRCPQCGLVWIDPFLLPEGLKLYYSQYLPARFENSELMQKREIQYKLDRDFLHNYIMSGRCLGVGCSGGFFLDELDENFEKHGIDIDPQAVAFASDNFSFGHQVHEAELGKDGFSDHSFDCKRSGGQTPWTPSSS